MPLGSATENVTKIRVDYISEIRSLFRTSPRTKVEIKLVTINHYCVWSFCTYMGQKGIRSAHYQLYILSLRKMFALSRNGQAIFGYVVYKVSLALKHLQIKKNTEA